MKLQSASGAEEASSKFGPVEERCTMIVIVISERVNEGELRLRRFPRGLAVADKWRISKRR